MDKETFKKYGYEFIDWVADYLEEVEKYPVKPPIKPGEIKEKIPTGPPSRGESMDKIFGDFKEIILPGITHWQHPCWYGYFPANNSYPSILGELLSAGLGVQCMSWETSPAATELEEVVLQWLGQMLGLPRGMAGVIQDTASTATLCALLTAREAATGFKTNEGGLKVPLTLYASEEAHSSVEKGVKIAGYGREYLRYIPADENFALVPSLLEEAVERDKKRGYKPACAVASLGTTSSAGIDPLEAMAEICQRNDMWLHVDAAYGGSAAILEEKRDMLRGMEGVDSFVFNPHKWLLTNFDCSAYFVKDPDLLLKTMEMSPEYLKTSWDARVNNYRDWGIQLGRRFRALKLWFVLRSYGVEGLQEMIREHLRLADLFREWIEKEKSFELMAPVNFSLVCFRLNDGISSPGELERRNRALLEKINATGKVFLTHTFLKGNYTLRMAIGQRTTGEDHLQKAWDIIMEKAREVLEKRGEAGSS
ncbi:MAG: aspartate aminotransferase family protein [Candidatus Syntrophonatronum acetioxidans]|uniref:Aspartate aminotransferase family protein n=1 Tax=Candidatus Syntrophonatronum acetioxidans TaxID=1795816 RepID=A0A424YB06_9FIRM|nr:MAG: aspartate aminotransferase family protein [Candidatus Syntrophonatronum acetioxidans]